MRDMNFKVWDNEKGSWFQPIFKAYAREIEELLLTPEGELILRRYDKMEHESLFPNRFEKVWYTGLKDKNGREIYESDIVKWERIIYTDCSKSEVEYVEEPIVGEIYYVDGITIGLKEADGTGRILFPFHLLDSSQDFEVLGNIYENKDLLTTT